MWLWMTSGADVGEVRGEGADGDRVVGLVDDEDRDAGPLELAHGAARRQRDDRDVVPLAVEPGHEVVEVLLGAAARAGGEHLDDADALARRAAPGARTGSRQGSQAERGGAHRAAVRRTRRRWIGSSTAPHSYL